MGNPKLFRVIDRAVRDYNMIEENDRILIAASGGKDSTVLAEYFAARLKRPSPQFQAEALHIETDIGSPLLPPIRDRFAEWGIPLHIKTVSVLESIREGKKVNCWWCSNRRRTELSRFAQEHGFNKIALGHHLDDILETLLMNALQQGSLATMPPRLSFDKFPVTIIRPLCLADIPMIIRHAEAQQYLCCTCTCNYQANSTRKTARSRLEALTDGDYKLKRKLFDSLKNIQPTYLP